MYIKQFLKNLPGDYTYWKSGWYRQIESEYSLYHYKILLASFCIGILFPVFFFAIDIASGRTDLLANYIIPFFIMLLLIVYLAVRKNVALMSSLSLILAAVGFFCAVFLPGSRGVYRVVFMAFVPLAYELKGIAKGRIWSLLFLVSILGTVLLRRLGLLAGSNPMFDNNQIVMGVFGYILMTVLVESGERQHEKQLRRVVERLVFDTTTGLPNKEALLHSIREDETCVLAIISVDNFNELTGLFGYDLSDELITFASERVIAREGEFGFKTYKLLYHEFAVLKREADGVIDETGIECMLTSLWSSLRKEPLMHDGVEIHINYRIGGVIVQPGEAAAALSKADMALISGRRKHRPVTVLFDAEKEKRKVIDSAHRFNILSKNIENKTFKSLFQPIKDPVTGGIWGHECLLRLKNDGGSHETIYPYLSLAESTGVYGSITSIVLKTAEEALHELDGNVAINITLSDILRHDFIRDIEEVCERTRSRPGRLVLEIIEKDDLVELDDSIRFLQKARDAGCMIAIDDFGAGFSNYTNLLSLPTDIIKIDGALVRRIIHDENAMIMVESIAGLCGRMKKLTVAEYVEDERILEHVRRLGINLVQGYYIGHPVSLDEIKDRRMLN